MEYDIEAILEKYEDDYNPGPRPMNQGPRNMYNQGQLVRNTVDGSRPGYGGWTDYSNPTKKQKQIAEKVYKKDFHKLDTIKKYGIVHGGTTGRMNVSGSGGIPTTEKPSLIKKVEKILKQNIEKKGGANVFKITKGVTTSGYAKNGLIDKVIKGTDGKLKNLTEIKKLIDRITKENGWLTKQDYRKWTIVDSFMKDYGINDEFTGKGKYDARLNEFKLKHKGSEFAEIHQTFKNWIKGDFEVDGYDRSKFDKHLNKNLKNWKPVVLTEKMIQLETELKWLNNVNTKYPNWTQERVEKAFNNKFKKNQYWSDTTFKNRSIDLYGTLVHGKTKNGRVIEGVNKGERSKWVKNIMKEVKGGNYYRFLTAADKYEADGNMKAAKKLRDAAQKLFLKDEGIFYGLGQAEHPWFSNYGGTKGMFQIDSLVKGDLNSFKANNFEIPIRDLIKKYEAKTATPLQQQRIMNEINLRRNFLNTMTDIGDGGMARDVTFDLNSEPGKIKVINKTSDVYDLYKKGKLDPLELHTRGTNYRDILIKTFKDVDVNILKKGTNEIKTQKLGLKNIENLLEQLCPNKASGGRIGFKFAGGVSSRATCGARFLEARIKDGKGSVPQRKLMADIIAAGSKLKKIGSSILNPIELLNPKNWVGPQALALMTAFEIGDITYDAINNNKPIKEALGDNWILRYMTPYNQAEEQVKAVEEANLATSPAMQNYMKKVKIEAEYEREYKKLKNLKTSLQTGSKSPEAIKKVEAEIENQQAVVDKVLNNYKQFAKDTSVKGANGMPISTLESGKQDFEKAFGTIIDKRQGGEWKPGFSENAFKIEDGRVIPVKNTYEGKYVNTGSDWADSGDLSHITGQHPYKYKIDLGKDQSRNMSETERKTQELFPFEKGSIRADYTKPTYKDFNYIPQKLPDDRRQAAELGLTEIGILPPRTSLSQLSLSDGYSYLDFLTDDYNYEQKAKQGAMYPGYGGTQEPAKYSPFSEGGITGLRSKYEYKK